MIVRSIVDELGVDQRDRSLSAIVREIVHRIDFSHDSGGGRWADVSPIAREALTGFDVAERFRDCRVVEDDEPQWMNRPGAYTGGLVPYTFLVQNAPP